MYSGLTYWLENVADTPQQEPVLVVHGPLTTTDGKRIVPAFSGAQYPCDWDGDGDMDLIGVAGDATGAGFYENTQRARGTTPGLSWQLQREDAPSARKRSGELRGLGW